MNITPVNFLSFKGSSSIDKLGLSPEERYSKADKNLVYVYDDRFGFKNSSSLIPTKRSEIILRREEIKAKINAIKKDRDAQVQDIRDYQQQLKNNLQLLISSAAYMLPNYNIIYKQLLLASLSIIKQALSLQ